MAQQRHVGLYTKTAEILLELLQLTDTTFDAFLHARAAARYGSDYRRVLSLVELRNQRRLVRRLAERKLIEEKKIGDNLRLVLTNTGRIEACRLAVLRADFFPDDRMTMVVFDIPESKRAVRKVLRDFLSSSGFYPMQRSVWISQSNAVSEIDALLRATDIGRWVRVFTVIDPEDERRGTVQVRSAL